MSNNGLIDSDAWSRPKTQIITTSTKVYWMPGATHVSSLIIGGGGGGGSGKYDSAAAANGGSGGSGGSLRYFRRMPYSFLQALFIRMPFEVTIGAGGTGGAGQTVSGNNGNSGVAGGLSKIVLNSQFATTVYSNLFISNTVVGNGGGKGTFGTATFANADASSNGSGQFNGLTGGQAANGGGVSLGNSHSSNSFGTNPFYFVGTSGGRSGGGKASPSHLPLGASSFFYADGFSTGTDANVDGTNASVFDSYLREQVEAYPVAPNLEEIAWITTMPGGGNGAGGTTGIGGAGGKGHWGSGGGGSGGTGASASGNGGDGGNGVVVFWWEKLQ